MNLKNESDVVKLAEPWFLVFNAQVEFRVAMTVEDMGRARLDALGKQWS